jgi:hypothetical protein
MDIFSSFSEIQKLKVQIFKMFWDTVRCVEKHKDLSEGGRVDIRDMERYLDITEGVRDIMGNKERDLAMTGFFRPNYEDRHVVGHHRGLLGQAEVPDGVHGHHGGLQGQIGLLSVP